LIQIGAISILLCQHKPLFHCWKDIWCWKLPCRLATSENDRLHIYSLWKRHMHSSLKSWPIDSASSVRRYMNLSSLFSCLFYNHTRNIYSPYKLVIMI
jgi:hypothetical protein